MAEGSPITLADTGQAAKEPAVVKPSAEAASDPKSPEAAKKDQQSKEVNKLVSIIASDYSPEKLHEGETNTKQEADRLRKEGKTQEADDLLNTYWTPGRIALGSLWRLQNAPETIRGTGENLLEVGDKKITGFLRSDEETLYCKVEGQEGEIAISRQAVLDAQLLAEADVILAEFEEGSPERTLLELKIRTLKEGEDTVLSDTLAADKAILDLAGKRELTTAKTMESFVKHMIPETKGENLTQAQIDQNEKRQSALKILEGKNLADAQTVIDVLEATGITPRTLIAQLPQATEYMQNAEEAYKRYPSAENLQRLKEAQMKVNLLKRTAEQMETGGPLEYFEKMERGEVPAETRGKVNEALRNGDLKTLIEIIAPELKDDSLKMADYLKGSGLGLLLLLYLGDKLFSSIGEGNR